MAETRVVAKGDSVGLETEYDGSGNRYSLIHDYGSRLTVMKNGEKVGSVRIKDITDQL